MNNQKGFVSIILTIIITALLIGGATYFWQQQVTTKLINDKTNQLQQQSQDQLKILQEKISDLEKAAALAENEDTDNWQTYTNSDLGYTINYPEEYILDFEHNTSAGVWWKVNNVKGFSILYHLEKSDGSLATWFDNTPVGDITLGGISGKKFSYRYCDGPGCGPESVAYVIQYKGKLLGLVLSGDYEIDTNEQKIIDSFKFLNIDISDWQNFKDANFNYSFSYPKNWNLKTNYKGYLLSYTDIVNYEIGSNNAPISFGAYAIDSKMDNVISFANKQYHIDTDERLTPDSIMIIDGKKFDKYDLIDSGQYEGDSAGNVVILASQDSLSTSENVRLVFTWEEKPAGNVLANNNKSDFLDIIATIKIE